MAMNKQELTAHFDGCMTLIMETHMTYGIALHWLSILDDSEATDPFIKEITHKLRYAICYRFAHYEIEDIMAQGRIF